MPVFGEPLGQSEDACAVDGSQGCCWHRAVDPGSDDRNPVPVVGHTDQVRRREPDGERSENLGLSSMHHWAHRIQDGAGCLDKHDLSVVEIATRRRSG